VQMKRKRLECAMALNALERVKKARNLKKYS
jgi:hypothetical protein